MKKLLVIFVCLFVIPFSSCKKEVCPYEEKITQLRQNIFFAETDEFTLLCYPERRENPLENDGFVGKVENFVIFKLVFKQQTNNEQSFCVSFKINEISYSGQFEYKPIANNLECSVKVDSLEFEQLFLTLTAENSSSGITLSPKKNSSTVNYLDVIELLNQNDEEAKNILSSENCEIRVRLIDNDGYDYWYIGLLNADDKVSFLIDGENGEVLAKKDLV